MIVSKAKYDRLLEENKRLYETIDKLSNQNFDLQKELHELKEKKEKNAYFG